MPTTQDKIKVRWQKGKDGWKGTIMEDPKGRKKIVFIERRFRGRDPNADEVTEGEVTYEKNPGDPNTGFLAVRPIYAADPNPLSFDDVRVKFEERVRAVMPQQYVFDCDVVIKVEDLPGWKGELVGRRSEKLHQNGGRLCMFWLFRGQNGHTASVWDGGSPYFLITPAIQWRQGYAYWAVTNWSKAVADLGMPVAVQIEEWSHRYKITWRDHQGLCFTAEVDEHEVATFKDPPFPSELLESGQ